MGVSELRQLGPQAYHDARVETPIGEELVRSGKISRSDMLLAQKVARHCDTTLDRILISEGFVTEEELLAARARQSRTRRLSSEEVRAAGICETDYDPRDMLKHGFVPLRDEQDRVVLATADPERLQAAAAVLPVELAGVPRLLAPRRDVLERVAAHARETLTDLAQARVQALESCRDWGERINQRMVIILLGLVALCTLTAIYPTAIFALFTLWAGFTLLVTALVKTAAFVATLSQQDTVSPPPDRVKAPLPKVSILVPLFREREILHALIARLTQLTYPKCLLDVVLILEEEDQLTQDTLAEIDLPSWIHAVVVPDGTPRTKPRAMNYALDFCQGDIIGIYDAEDAPEPDQITVVARRFQALPRDVACLQGILDYYNPQQNWLARCFTIEYSAWFRMILPGMARLGFAIPLGGTTLYFRRDVLEELGGWDAHNVTEDADLGFRLARHGYRTEMVDTVTEEEANCHLWPWIRQRSRWLKGYMVTYLVHMRDPGLLYRQLGAWKFLGFQAHFLAALSQFLLAPFLWSFWLILLGLPHPMEPVLPRDILLAVGTVFLMIEVLNLMIYMAAVANNKHKALLPWVPTMHVYSPLGAIAAYKALYEIIFKPFFWDKTKHGLSLPHVAIPGFAGSGHTSDLAAVELEAGHKSL